jgi:hypothetical protein
MLESNMKAFRARHALSVKRAGALLGISGEGYRLKEAGKAPIAGTELARLAESCGESLSSAFPSYRPTPDELALLRQMSGAA